MKKIFPKLLDWLVSLFPDPPPTEKAFNIEPLKSYMVTSCINSDLAVESTITPIEMQNKINEIIDALNRIGISRGN